MVNTYGVIIFDPSAKVLIAKPTGSNIWSFPKGIPDMGETPKETAIRETLEETGLDLTKIKGKFSEKVYSQKYSKSNKTVHIFVFVSDEDLLNKELVCTSTFEMYGRIKPENEAFKWVFPEEAKSFVHEAQQRVLSQLISDQNL